MKTTAVHAQVPALLQDWQPTNWAMQVHGTIGVLLRSIRRGQRTPEEVLSLLQQLPQRSTWHIRSDLLLAVVAQVQQEFDLPS